MMGVKLLVGGGPVKLSQPGIRHRPDALAYGFASSGGCGVNAAGGDGWLSLALSIFVFGVPSSVLWVKAREHALFWREEVEREKPREAAGLPGESSNGGGIFGTLTGAVMFLTDLPGAPKRTEIDW